MKLEQIYESYYVDPLVAINSSSAAELLEAFEQAAVETSDIREILASINEDQMPVNESELSNEQKIFFIGATKLVTAYKESVDTDFKARFESLINDARVRKTATPTTAPVSTTTGTTSPKKGFLSKLGSFFGNVGRGIAAFTRGVIQGFTGSEGKDKTGKDKPGWTSTTASQDLSKIPEKGVAFTPDQLKTIGVDNDTISKLQNGEIAGVNITDSNNNLISVSLTSGRLFVKKVPTYKAAVDNTKRARAGGASPKSKTPASKTPAPGAAPVSKTPASKTPAPGAAPASKTPAKVKTPAPGAAPASKTPAKVKTPREKGKIIPFSTAPDRKKREVRAETQFQKTTRAVLREFYETNK